jgi:hypothetical protein
MKKKKNIFVLFNLRIFSSLNLFEFYFILFCD